MRSLPFTSDIAHSKLRWPEVLHEIAAFYLGHGTFFHVAFIELCLTDSGSM